MYLHRTLIETGSTNLYNNPFKQLTTRGFFFLCQSTFFLVSIRQTEILCQIGFTNRGKKWTLYCVMIKLKPEPSPVLKIWQIKRNILLEHLLFFTRNHICTVPNICFSFFLTRLLFFVKFSRPDLVRALV
jgi:hypothetical protein